MWGGTLKILDRLEELEKAATKELPDHDLDRLEMLAKMNQEDVSFYISFVEVSNRSALEIVNALRLLKESRNALPELIAVARAARNLDDELWQPGSCIDVEKDVLREALAKLEALDETK